MDKKEVSQIPGKPTPAPDAESKDYQQSLITIADSLGSYGTTTTILTRTEFGSETETEVASEALTIEGGTIINTDIVTLSEVKAPSNTSQMSKPSKKFDNKPKFNEWTMEPSDATTASDFTKVSEEKSIAKPSSEIKRGSDEHLTIQEAQELEMTIPTELTTEKDKDKDVKDANIQFDASTDDDDEDSNEHALWVDDLVYPDTDEEVKRAMNLFSTVMDSERIKMMKFSSMLISGFGLRNYPSLCRALQYQQQLDKEYKRRKQMEEEQDLAKLKRLRELERYHRSEYKGESGTSFSNLGSQTDFSSISLSTHQDTTAEQRRRIEYLMGLHTGDEGWEEDAGTSTTASMISEMKSCGPEKEEVLTGGSDAMRQAQQYLRTHHIFEFFQFLIVHILSELPENPIEYLLVLLDRLLIYRSGLGVAPLHYKKKHLEQLFYLMDRMRTGFIDMKQYRTGLHYLKMPIK